MIVSPIVESGGARTLMVGHLLGHLEPPAVAQVLRDAGSPEGVAANLSGHAGGLGPSPDHPIDVRLAHGPV